VLVEMPVDNRIAVIQGSAVLFVQSLWICGLTGSSFGFLNRKFNKHNLDLADISDLITLQSHRQTVFYLA
jgi:hypothetical protein